jgi:PEGA domain
MHPSDVLVIGPIHPNGSRALRVPIRNLLIAALVIALAIALAGVTLAMRVDHQRLWRWLPDGFAVSKMDASAASAAEIPTFEVGSNPAGATVRVDGHDYGRTPVIVAAAAGKTVTLQRDGFLDAFAISTRSPLSLQLWRAQPDLRTIRPPTPAAIVTSADFLPDGRVALAVQVPPTGERQAWAYDPMAAAVERLGHAAAPGALPSSVAIAPDGVAAAAIVHLDGLDGAAADRLELDDADGQHELLSNDAASRGELLLDISWSPAGYGMLVVGQQSVKGGNRFHLLFVECNGQSRDLAELAGQPVVGSWAWAPDGHAVAFGRFERPRAGGAAPRRRRLWQLCGALGPESRTVADPARRHHWSTRRAAAAVPRREAAVTCMSIRRPILLGGVLVVAAVALLPTTAFAQPAIPNPLDGLLNSPQAPGQLLQRVGTYLLDQAVHGLHYLLIALTQGEENVVTHTPASLTYQHPLVVQWHDTLATAINWGLAAAIVVTGILVILGPSSPLSYPAAGEILPRVVIAFLVAHSSLQWGGWFIELSNVLCNAVAPADPFPLSAANNLDEAFGLLGLALLYGFMALFLGLFMFARVVLLAVLLIVAPLAAVVWVLPGRPRLWGELWMDLFFSNLFVQFLQVLTLSFGVQLLQTAGGDVIGMRQFLAGAATLLLVFRIPALVSAGVGGGATSCLGLVSLFRGLQTMGVTRLSTQAQQQLAHAPAAAWNSSASFVRNPRAAIAQELSGMANSPAGRTVRAAAGAANAAVNRVREEVVVRRGA